MPDARTRKRWALRRDGQPGRNHPDPPPQSHAAHDLVAAGFHPVVAQLLAQRGAATPDDAKRFLEPRLSHLRDPESLPGCADAARRLAQAVQDQRPVVIYGDYDVDGVTASSILHHTLVALGAAPETYIPHRVDEGYGLNADAVRAIADKSDPARPTLVVTVDCGIASVEPVRIAKERGLEVVVTDHHRFDPENLPSADALVHPGLGEDGEPPDALCGAGVAFKLAWQTLREAHGSPASLPERLRTLLVELVGLAALGTIADIVPLVGENRVLAAVGLARLPSSSLPGVRALMAACNLLGESVDAQHVGFVLGPRLNAVGRMGHAGEAAELLSHAQGERARDLAEGLSKVNNQRRKEERRVLAEALEQIEAQGFLANDRMALLVAGEGWHPGVVGVVASRLVDRYQRPAIVLSINPDTGAAKGSGRSIDGFDLFHALEPHRERMQRFGGHGMAVGLTVDADKVDDLRQAFCAAAGDRLTEADLTPVVRVDLDVEMADCTPALADQLASLAPFGRSNPAPVLRLTGATLAQAPRRMGKSGDHLSLALRSPNGRGGLRAVGFGFGDWAEELREGADIDAVGTLRINEWRGLRSAEFQLTDVRPAMPAENAHAPQPHAAEPRVATPGPI